MYCIAYRIRFALIRCLAGFVTTHWETRPLRRSRKVALIRVDSGGGRYRHALAGIFVPSRTAVYAFAASELSREAPLDIYKQLC